ncbi:MAG TPA: ABC transporter permease [Longimicrobiaceae bacterium]|nr:ABC transporter permease [Longimicrobiaceae bacterium]
MATYLLRRLLGAVPLLLGTVTLLFFLIHLAPGDPSDRFVGAHAPPGLAAQMHRLYGLDQPLPVQYARWVGAFARGDFGESLVLQRPVREIVPQAVWNTLQLSGLALLLIFAVGIAIGILQAMRPRSAADHAFSLAAFVFSSVPGFWLGLMLLFVFAVKFGEWGLVALPVAGMSRVDAEFLPAGARLADRAAHLVLPVATLTLVGWAGIARYMRGSMLEVVGQDFIRTARAKGLRERDVMLRHAVRNALIPVVTLLGLELPFLLSGAVLAEEIFSWPGMGRLLVDSIAQRDYPVVMATQLALAITVIGGNLLADALYALVDPRVRGAG